MKSIVLTILLLLLSVTVNAQPESLQDILNKYAKAEDAAVVVMVTTPQGSTLAAAGMADDTRAATGDDRFRIASISKTFVAVTTLLLVEEGVFELDDRAAEWLPQPVLENIANADQVTIRQLLSMRSGIEDYLARESFFEAIEADPTFTWMPLDVLAYVYDLEPLAEPDTTFAYSNTNYVLLQLVLENASGLPLHELIRTRILDPLGLENTYTQISESLEGGFVNGYSDFDRDNVLEDVTAVNDGAGLGDGGLISNAQDLTVFYRALLDEQRILSEESLAELMRFQPMSEVDGYGLGLFSWQIEDVTALGHTGGVLGFISLAAYIPDSQTSIVVLSARDNFPLYLLVMDILSSLEG